jgi:hypothetical protein
MSRRCKIIGWLLASLAIARSLSAEMMSVGELLKKSVEDQSQIIEQRSATLADMLRSTRFHDGTPKPPEKIEADKKLSECMLRQFAVDPESRFPKGLYELMGEINSANKRNPATDLDTVLVQFVDDRCTTADSRRASISVAELQKQEPAERARLLSARLRHVINDLLESAKLPDGSAKPPDQIASDNQMADCILKELTPPQGAPVSKGIVDLMSQIAVASSLDPFRDVDSFLIKYIRERCGSGKPKTI